jgi:type IV pilus assembly protein PilB
MATETKNFLNQLIAEKIVSEKDLSAIQKESLKSQKTPEELLIQKGVITEENLFKLKSNFLKIPLRKLEEGELIPEEVLKEISDEVAAHYRFIALSKSKDFLEVGMVDPEDLKAQEALKFIQIRGKLPIKTALMTFSDFDAALRQYKSLKGEVTSALDKLSTELEEGKLELAKRDEKKGLVDVGATIFEEAPITKLVAVIIKHAFEGRASDIHIEPGENDLRVRYRVDGVLYTSLILPKNIHAPVLARIKILCNMKIDESRVPQDGRFRIRLENNMLDFRVSVFPTQRGEKAALRLLDPTAGDKTLEDLGVLGGNRSKIEWAARQPYGMMLITGPTGSGKSTSLSVLLRFLNKEGINIITLEDPVEYEMPGVNQSQIRPEIGYTFAAGLRHILRQDPDIIMVGEIRDRETASLAVQAALTGHTLLSTLHTNNAVGVIPRLIDMGVEPFLLPSALLLMVAQRLVRRLCENCKEKIEAPEIARKFIMAAIEEMSEDTKKTYNFTEPYYIYKGRGCKKCGLKGVKGRIAIFEMFTMTPQLEAIILGGMSETKIEAEAVRQGMVTLKQDAIIKALQGYISLEEALEVIKDQEEKGLKGQLEEEEAKDEFKTEEFKEAEFNLAP